MDNFRVLKVGLPDGESEPGRMKPFYHATTRDRLPLIKRLGLRAVAEKNFECENGVYLAGSPELALMFVIEAHTGVKSSFAAPRDVLDALVVLVVDGCMVDSTRLSHDPHVEDVWQSWLYDGVIDVTNAPILGVDEVLDDQGRSRRNRYETR